MSSSESLEKEKQDKMIKNKGKTKSKVIKIKATKRRGMLMKITGTIEFPDPESRRAAAKILQALSPDNLRSMESEISGDKVAVWFHAEKIGSLLATVDDFLMNVKIGEGIEQVLEKEEIASEI